MHATQSSDLPPRSLIGLCWGVAILAALALVGVALWFGDLNQDEGWYSYAGCEVARGRLPFIHFATTQGPVMPFVYALAAPLVGSMGLAGARLFTAMLGLGAAAGAAWLAACLTAPGRGRGVAAVVAFSLAAVNVYQCYFFTIVKTYALTGLLLVVAFALLALAREGRARLALPAGFLMALAAGTRSSAGFAAAAAFIGLLWAGWRESRSQNGGAGDADATSGATRLAVWLAAGGAIGGVLVFGPFAVLAPEGLWFALAEYHTGREVGGTAVMLAYKGGFVSRVASAYLVACGLILCGVLRRLFGGDGDDVLASRSWFSGLVWWSVGAVTLVHILAPFPYDDYQTIIYPLVAAVLGQGITGWVLRRQADAVGARGKASWVMVSVLALCLLAAGASPMTWQWFLGERDRIWWPLKEQGPLAVLRDAGGLVKEHTDPSDTLLTQDTYLAVEAGLRVPAGLELGPFSYFPDWDTEKARSRHVVNREMLLAMLRSADAPLAAVSGYGLSIRCPEVAPLTPAEEAELRAALNDAYEPLRSWARFGQADTEMQVLVRKRRDL